MMFRVCMSVCYDIRDGLVAGSYVCTYGAILMSESGVRASAHALSQLDVHACRPELASTET